MPKLSEFLAERAKGEVQIGSKTLEFTFFVVWRERFSDDEWGELLALRGRDYLKRLLPRIVESWDLVDDDGHAIPVTAEAFDEHHIPDAILFGMEKRAIGSDLAGKVTSNNSHDT